MSINIKKKNLKIVGIVIGIIIILVGLFFLIKTISTNMKINETKEKLSQINAEELKTKLIEELEKTDLNVDFELDTMSVDTIVTEGEDELEGFTVMSIMAFKNNKVVGAVEIPCFKIESDNNGKLKNIEYIQAKIMKSVSISEIVRDVFKNSYNIEVWIDNNSKYNRSFNIKSVNKGTMKTANDEFFLALASRVNGAEFTRYSDVKDFKNYETAKFGLDLEKLESESKTNKENMKSFVEKSNTITGMNFAFTKEEFSEKYLKNYQEEIEIGLADKGFTYQQTQENLKIYANSLYRAKGNAIGMAEKYLKNYQEEIEIGLADKGFTYQQTQENLKIYANSLYRAKGNAIGMGKEEHFIVMLLEEPTNNKIVRVMGSIINFSSQNEKLQQTSINGVINMYKVIDESITEEKAKSIIKDISGKIKNNGQPAIYENGVLYSAEEYTNNGYKYTRFSATAVTKEKAKEIYGVEF